MVTTRTSRGSEGACKRTRSCGYLAGYSGSTAEGILYDFFCTISRLHTRLTPRRRQRFNSNKHSPPDTRPSRAVRTRAAGAGRLRRRRARPACVHTEHTRAITRGGRRTHTRYRGPATYPTSTPAARRSHPATRGVCGPSKYTHRHTRTDTGSLLRARRASVITRHADAAHPMSTRTPRSLSHILQNIAQTSPTSHAPRLTRSLLPNANRQRARDPKPRSVPHPRFPSTLGHTEHTLAPCWYHRPSTPRSPLSRIQI